MRHWRFSLIFAIICSLWLVSTTALAWLVLNVTNFWAYIFFEILALPFFAVSVIVSLVHLLRKRGTNPWGAVMPLAVNVVAIALVFSPLRLPMERIEYAVHYVDRMEMVRRIASGELWDGSPLRSIVHVPRDYARSVSGGPEFNSVTVYRDGGALHVVFYPARGNLLVPSPALLYRCDGLPPTLPNRVLPNSRLGASLGDGWYTVPRSGLLQR